MTSRFIRIMEAEGGLVSEETPPFMPDLQAGQFITIKGRTYQVTAIDGDLSTGGTTIAVKERK